MGWGTLDPGDPGAGAGQIHAVAQSHMSGYTAIHTVVNSSLAGNEQALRKERSRFCVLQATCCALLNPF